jgi:hypothetical protein
LERFKEDMIETYAMDTELQTTDSENFTSMMNMDQGKYYNILLSIINQDLISDTNVEEKIESVIQSIDENVVSASNTEQSNTCKNFILTKHYTTIEDIEYDDTQTEIYFDKKYDQTQYDIIKEYEVEQSTMDAFEFKEFLTKKLQENIGLSEKDAILDADAMILGKRVVRDGNYAVLFDQDNENNRKYFKYTNGKWEYDNDITGIIVKKNENDVVTIEEQRVFCNVSDKCISIKNTSKACDSLETGQENIIQNSFQNLTKQIMDDYIENTDVLKGELEKIRIALKTQLERMKIYKYNTFIKNNNSFYNVGLDVNNENIITSPYARLRDLILAENDLFNKANYILKFIKQFTRSANSDNDESSYWFYCNNTNTKLLPTFYETLSLSLYNNTYNETLDVICKERGEISDDGDKWVDKYSGYSIRMIESSVEEGYDATGYKIQTNDILEQDIGTAYKLQASKTEAEKDIKLKASPESIMIQKIVNALSRYSGIQLNEQNTFIIKNVEEKINKILPNKEEYERKAKIAEQQNKKVTSYEDNKNKLILLFTGLYFLITIQTSVPILKTKKTMEGCTKSFTGYPMENTSDYSGLKYIVCIMKKISSNSKPWNTIHKTRIDVIEKNMVAIFDKSLSKDVEIQNRYKAREIYLKEHTDIDTIPEVHKLSKWNTFLPPLSSLSGIQQIQNITSEFREELMKNMLSGNKQQLEKLFIIKSKILYFTIGIQHAIQKIIDNETPLLQTLNGQPFVENFCCNLNKNINTLYYFISKDKSVQQYNDVVENLSKLYYDTLEISQSPILLYNKDTKIRYPQVNKDFSEETIYRAFIQYCRINKNIPLNNALLPLCIDNTSNFDTSDTIETKIKVMKEEGKIYSLEMFKQLLNIINRENIVSFNYDSTSLSSKAILEKTLQDFDDNDSDVNPILREKLSNLLQTFENVFEDQTAEMKDIRNFLLRANAVMKENISQYLKKFASFKSTEERNINEFLNTFIEFKNIDKSSLLSSSDETAIYTINYLKIIIRQLCIDFPNIIMNEIKHEESNIPKHWGFSQVHNSDIKKFIESTYENLKGHKTPTIVNVLMKLQDRVKDILTLVNNTPFMSSYKIKSTQYTSIFNAKISKELYTFYLFSALESYIELQNVKIDTLDTQQQTLFEISEQTGLDAYETTPSHLNIETNTTNDDAFDLIEGMRFDLNKSIANMLTSFIKIFMKHKKMINYNKENIYDLVLRVNEYEKETKRRYLKSLTTEERKVDGELRKAKMGQWAVGLEEGVTKYNPDFYDKERKQMEKEALLDIQLGYNTQVTELNRDILSYKTMLEEEVEEELNEEAYDMSGLPDDDDYGDDRDGDEHFY